MSPGALIAGAIMVALVAVGAVMARRAETLHRALQRTIVNANAGLLSSALHTRALAQAVKKAESMEEAVAAATTMGDQAEERADRILADIFKHGIEGEIAEHYREAGVEWLGDMLIQAAAAKKGST